MPKEKVWIDEEKEEIALWISRYNTDKVKKRYLKHLTSYCEFHGKTPIELLAIKSDGKESTAEKMLDRFVLEWDKPDSIKANAVSTVRSFYKANYLDLAKAAGAGVKYRRIGPYRNPTTDQLREMCLGAHIRDIAIINVFSSGGFRVGTLSKLTWGHVSEIDDWNGVDPIHVGVTSEDLKGAGYGKYEDLEQHAFLTPHAVRILIRYRIMRESWGEVITPESPLFATLKGAPKDPKAERPKVKHLSHPRRLGERMIRFTLNRMCEGKGFYFSPHDLRRYTQTQLEVARVQPNWIRKMLGKKVPMAEAPYSLPKIEQMREAYRGAIAHVTLAPPKAQLSPTEQRIQTILDQVAIIHGPDSKKFLDIKNMLKLVKTDKQLDGKMKDVSLAMAQAKLIMVPEEEAQGYFDRGYTYKGSTPNGKVVLEK